jgi:hypothetical protein
VLRVLQDGEPFRQKNEGKWEFVLADSEDGSAVVLDVALSRFMDTSLIQADVQPTYVRLLVKVRQSARKQGHQPCLQDRCSRGCLHGCSHRCLAVACQRQGCWTQLAVLKKAAMQVFVLQQLCI